VYGPDESICPTNVSVPCHRKFLDGKVLDTQLLLWAAHDPKRLTRAARALIGNAENEPFFSAVTLRSCARASIRRRDTFLPTRE